MITSAIAFDFEKFKQAKSFVGDVIKNKIMI